PTPGVTAGARQDAAGPGVPPGAVQPVSSPPPAAKPVVNHPLWAQAEAAERDGKYDEAERLYFELARVMNGPGGDHDVANLCYTRIHGLREKKRAGPAPTATAGANPDWAAPKENRAGLLPPSPNSGAPAALPNPNS